MKSKYLLIPIGLAVVAYLICAFISATFDVSKMGEHLKVAMCFLWVGCSLFFVMASKFIDEI